MEIPNDWEWDNFTTEQVAEMKGVVREMFPDATLDNDGTFTCSIVEIYKIIRFRLPCKPDQYDNAEMRPDNHYERCLHI